jgi:hypothetical protein
MARPLVLNVEQFAGLFCGTSSVDPVDYRLVDDAGQPLSFTAEFIAYRFSPALDATGCAAP